jgi:hypothetical protein
MLSEEQIAKVVRGSRCPNPRCPSGGSKPPGQTFCRRCLDPIPEHMRTPRMLDAAIRFLDVKFRSVREFGGGRRFE